MTLYVDSSALIKRYVAEDDSQNADAILLGDTEWVTGRHAYIEVQLAIHRRLGEAELRVARMAFERDWQRTFVVGLDDVVCRRAAELGIATGSRSLDALHLAAAERAGGRSVPIVTFDVRLGQAARSLGFGVIGS
ncbi:MAG: VapC toxin family PIN domain ribonuclease [Anaerolinea sp.]|nr:VapC toxin family PIN domain ribonuclease [Anaerolinea sp.]